MGCTLVWASDEKEMEEIRRRVGVGTGVELAGRCTGTAVSLSDPFSHRPVCLCLCVFLLLLMVRVNARVSLDRFQME